MPLFHAVSGRSPGAEPRLFLLGALLLTACGAGTSSTSTSTTSVKDALNFTSTNLPVGYVGEAYNAPLPVGGGVSPYLVKLVDGSLPDGLTLSSAGIVGTPKTVGAYGFTLEASDASLSTKDQKFSLTVSAQVAFALSPVLPNGPVGPSRIPLILSHPLGAVAARFQWKLPAGVGITAVSAGDGAPVLIWHQKGNMFTLDLGFRRVPQNGAQVAMLTLNTKNPVLLASAPTGYQGRDATGALVKGTQDVNASSLLNPLTSTSTGGISTLGGSGTGTLGTSGAGSSVGGTSTNGLSTQGSSADSTQASSGAGTSTDAGSTDAASTDGDSVQGASGDAAGDSTQGDSADSDADSTQADSASGTSSAGDSP